VTAAIWQRAFPRGLCGSSGQSSVHSLWILWPRVHDWSFLHSSAMECGRFIAGIWRCCILFRLNGIDVGRSVTDPAGEFYGSGGGFAVKYGAYGQFCFPSLCFSYPMAFFETD